MSGRLEVYHDGAWGTICDDAWDRTNAEVACRQLGLGPPQGGSLYDFQPSTTAVDSMRIWMDDIYCTGGEATLQSCPFSGWGDENCDHSEDVGLSCALPNTMVMALDSDPTCVAGRCGELQVRGLPVSPPSTTFANLR